MALSRRAFIRNTAATGAAATFWGGALTAQGASLAAIPLPPFPWAEATIAELQSAMTAGSLTARSLTQAYLDRIALIDAAGPRLNSVIELNPAALALADQLDAERAAGRIRGPLHGMPILLKDNIATADAMQTTAGSLVLVGAQPPADAGIVDRLRAAGAVILGKTNLSEWANFRSTKSISGWSGRGRQTRNPYVLDRNTSGSSSGSAVAVAANLCVAAIGTETDGSVVSPASVNGIVGVKPTVGLTSRYGIIPISASQDTAGPMARTVADAALLLAAMQGPDARDAATAAQPATTPAAYALTPDALRGKRVGVIREPFGVRPRVVALLDGMVATLKAGGVALVDPVDVGMFNEVGDAEWEVLLYEFKAGLEAWFAALGSHAPVKTLDELIAFNREHAADEMPYFDQEIIELAAAKGPLSEQAYLDAKATCVRLSQTEGLDRLFADHQLDALVAITNGPAWPIDPINGDSYTGGSSSLAAVSGYPSVTVPAAFYGPLPIGLSFIGPAWSEGLLLSLAADFESHTKARREPEFLPTVAMS